MRMISDTRVQGVSKEGYENAIYDENVPVRQFGNIFFLSIQARQALLDKYSHVFCLYG